MTRYNGARLVVPSHRVGERLLGMTRCETNKRNSKARAEHAFGMKKPETAARPLATRPMQESLRNRILGCLLGQALGLSIGELPVAPDDEPTDPAARLAMWRSRVERLADHPTALMTRVLVEIAGECSGFTSPLWESRCFFDLAVRGLLDVRASGPEAAALRSVVAALPVAWLEQDRETLALTQAWSTHKSSLCDTWCCAVQALAARCFGPHPLPPHELLAEVAEEVRRLDPVAAFELYQISSLLHLAPAAFVQLGDTAIPGLRGWLLSGVYAFMGSVDLLQALSTAAAVSTDGSSAAGLAGALFGASFGADALDPALVRLLPAAVVEHARQIAGSVVAPRSFPLQLNA